MYLKRGISKHHNDVRLYLKGFPGTAVCSRENLSVLMVIGHVVVSEDRTVGRLWFKGWLEAGIVSWTCFFTQTSFWQKSVLSPLLITAACTGHSWAGIFNFYRSEQMKRLWRNGAMWFDDKTAEHSSSGCGRCRTCVWIQNITLKMDEQKKKRR